MVDPRRFEAALNDELQHPCDGAHRAVASMCIAEIPELCRRYGALEIFDLTTELVRLVQAHLSDDDTYQVGEDGHVLVLARNSTIADLRSRIEPICAEIEARPWRDAFRLTAAFGVVDATRVDPTATAAQIVQHAMLVRLRAASAARNNRAELTGSLWAEPTAAVPDRSDVTTDRSELRRGRGPVDSVRSLEATRSAAVTTPTLWRARRDDIFSLREYRPPPESSRLSGAMVLPPQGSAMGVPLLLQQRSGDRTGSSIARASAAVDRLEADDDTPTHTRTALDVIQASLSAHASAALDAIEASWSGSTSELGAADPGPGGPDSFVLPRRKLTLPVRRTRSRSLPVRTPASPRPGAGLPRRNLPERARLPVRSPRRDAGVSDEDLCR